MARRKDSPQKAALREMMRTYLKENEDYALTVEDILAWEKEYCKIPEHAFVAFRSDWSKRKRQRIHLIVILCFWMKI